MDAPTKADTGRLRQRRVIERIGVALAYGVFGVLAGTLGTVVHRARILVGDTQLWLGIVAALIAIALVAVGLRLYLDERLAVFAFAAGVVITTFVLAGGGAGHSVLIPASQNGLGVGEIWTLGAPIVAFLPAIWPDLRSARATAAARSRAGDYPGPTNETAWNVSAGTVPNDGTVPNESPASADSSAPHPATEEKNS